MHRFAWVQWNVTKNIQTYSFFEVAVELELVPKESNHLAAILHVFAGGLNFMK